MRYTPEIHKRRSIRLQGYDYSQSGLYFLTICVYNMQYLFGRIESGTMILNDAGTIANQCWLGIPCHFPYAILHEHIIMPNHIHGIIELKNPHPVRAKNLSPKNFENPSPENHMIYGVKNLSPLLPHSPSRTIGSIIRGYKIGVTKWFRHTMPNEFPAKRPIWQRNYYERIIRDERAYHTISNYIANNPAKWQEDKFRQ